MVDDKQILTALREDVKQITPNVLDAAMNTPVQKMRAHDAITMQPLLVSKPKTRLYFWAFASSMAIFAMMLMVAFAGWYQFLRVDSLVGVDVNPSIEIQVNNMDRVVAVRALNDDAIPVISGIGYKQVKVQNVVNALMGSLYQHGYLQDAESAILITVENQNKTKAARLENKLVIEVKDLVGMPSSQVYSQVLPREVMEEEAGSLEVSMGILHLAIEARKLNPQMGMEELVRLPLNELYFLAHNKYEGSIERLPGNLHLTPTPTPGIYDGSFPQKRTPTPTPWFYFFGGDDDDDDDDEYDDD